jgi:hypothetical protein
VDDAAVIGFVIASVRLDLEKFMAWESASPSTSRS